MSGAVGAYRAESQAVTVCPHPGRELAALWHVVGYRHSLRQALKRTIITFKFKLLVLLLPRA